MTESPLDKARERYARARRANNEALASLAKAREVAEQAGRELDDALKWFKAYGGVET